MRAHELIAQSVSERVLVYGSLPPGGRDLDLLVRPAQAPEVEVALEEAGFARRGHHWARFGDCSVEPVEVTAASAFALPDDELNALFDEAVPIGGQTRLVQPAAHHALLILARRVAGTGNLDEKRRARLDAALGEDPAAFTKARERASAWRAEAALEALDGARRGDGTVPADLLSAARAERPEASLRERAAELRDGLPRLGRVIAFSGLDGAGKSSQVAALRETLELLGYDVTTAWTRVAWDDLIWRVGSSAKRLLGLVHRAIARGGPEAADGRADGPAPSAPEPRTERTAANDPIKRLRERSALLTHAWTATIALTNAIVQWRLMRAPLLRGDVVICDRYALDSIVALRHSYGAARRFSPQRLLLKALLPTPVRAYFLDVSPETAFERKGEWGIEWLASHRSLYLQECRALGVKLIDGERPLGEICAEIARDVWLSGI